MRMNLSLIGFESLKGPVRPLKVLWMGIDVELNPMVFGQASQSVRALVCLPLPFYHGVDLWYSGVSKKMSQEYSFFFVQVDIDLLSYDFV